MRRKIKHFEPWIVSLTERYEVRVLASSRKEAIEGITEFGGSGPIWHHVTARRDRRVMRDKTEKWNWKE